MSATIATTRGFTGTLMVDAMVAGGGTEAPFLFPPSKTSLRENWEARSSIHTSHKRTEKHEPNEAL
jgi:hypothetical protein